MFLDYISKSEIISTDYLLFLINHSLFSEISFDKDIESRSDQAKSEKINLAVNQDEKEDQIMIESETIEMDVKSNEKDDFSMDPIFNEIIEPSLRITSGKQFCLY